MTPPEPGTLTRPAHQMRARVVPVDEIDETLQGAWRCLATRAAEPNPFAEPEMVLPAARLLQPGSRPGLLIVQQGQELHFALPMVRAARVHRIPVSALVTWLHPYAFLGTPLLDPDRGTAAWLSILQMLHRETRCPRIVLPRLAQDGPVRSALNQALGERQLRPTTLDPTVRAVLRRRPDPAYLQTQVSPKSRKRLARQRQLLNADIGGELTYSDGATDPSFAGRAVESFLRLEASGWKGRAGTAVACQPRHAQFFQTTCAGFAQLGRLQLPRLSANGVTVAAGCLLLAGRAVFHLKVAYDETYARRSPGLQLEHELISQFHTDPRLDWIDSCSDGADSVSAQLYPDRRTLESVLVPVRGMHGHAASRLTPRALGTARSTRSAITRATQAAARMGRQQ